MNAGEIEKILGQADAVADKLKVSRKVALLLLITREVICIHYHIDEVLKERVKRGDEG